LSGNCPKPVVAQIINIEMGGWGGDTNKTGTRNEFVHDVANFRPAPVVFFMCV